MQLYRSVPAGKAHLMFLAVDESYEAAFHRVLVL